MSKLTIEEEQYVKQLLSNEDVNEAVIFVVMKTGISPFEAKQVVYDLI